jgi:hypothetical protein
MVSPATVAGWPRPVWERMLPMLTLGRENVRSTAASVIQESSGKLKKTDGLMVSRV